MLLRIAKIFVVVVVLLGAAWFLVDCLVRVVPGDGSIISGSPFSPDYFIARSRFRAKVTDRGGRLSSLAIDSQGPAGEDLTIDIGCFGAPKPRRVLLHSSGMHGAEGFAGSAIQIQLLDQPPAVPADSALVLIHVVNPYGMAWLRRVNENSVDLNRNFLDPPTDYSGVPEGFGPLRPLVCPTEFTWPDDFVPRAAWSALRYGLPAVRQILAGGQYQYPDCLFYGGRKLEQGPARLQEWLTEHFEASDRVVAVDVHTGLGEYGEDSLLVNEADYSRLRAILGERIVPMDPSKSPAYRIRGSFLAMLARVLKKGATVWVGQEFGTYKSVRVLRAMRDENRAHHADPRAALGKEGRALKEVFCPDDEVWRRRVLNRGAQLVAQARELAFGDRP